MVNKDGEELYYYGYGLFPHYMEKYHPKPKPKPKPTTLTSDFRLEHNSDARATALKKWSSNLLKEKQK